MKRWCSTQGAHRTEPAAHSPGGQASKSWDASVRIPTPKLRHRALVAALASILALTILLPEKVRAGDPHSIWPEVVLPGYNAFRNESYLSAGLLMAGRLLTLYGAYYFHVRHVNYASAARAARLGDAYYGPGLQYADPYSGDFLSSQEMENRSGRAQNYSHISIALHLGLMGAGLFQGYRIQQELQEQNLKKLEIQSAGRNSPGLSFGHTWVVQF